MNKISTKTKENIISYGLVLIGSIIYISLVFNKNVWLDEAFTASLVRTDMAGVLSRSMADTLPPLYNILLKISTDIFGYYVPVMKMTSVVPMIIIMLLSATVVRRQHGFKTSALFTIAMFTMPNLLFFGVEIRMYSLGLLFATASGIYSYEVITNYNKKNLAIFSIVSALAGYSHHFAFVSVGFVFLFMLIYYFVLERENIKRWFLCLLFTMVIYFPCLLVTLKQFKSVSGYFSMPDVTLSVFIKYARYPYTVGNTVASIVLLVSIICIVTYTVIKIVTVFRNNGTIITRNANIPAENIDESKANEDNSDINNIGDFANMSNIDAKTTITDLYALSMFLVYYGVLIFGTIISKIMTANIFVDRYLLFAHGMLWLFFAIEAGQFKKYYNVFVAVAIFVGICGYMGEVKIEYDTNPEAMISYLEANVEDGDVLYTIEDAEEMAFCLPFYDDKLTNYEELSEAVKAARNADSEIWLTVMDYSDYDFDELEEYNLKAIDPQEFSFDRYTFTLYRITE